MANAATRSTPLDQAEDLKTIRTSSSTTKGWHSSNGSSSLSVGIKDNNNETSTSPSCTPLEAAANAECPDLSSLKLDTDVRSTAVDNVPRAPLASNAPKARACDSPEAPAVVGAEVKENSQTDPSDCSARFSAAHSSTSTRSQSPDSGLSSKSSALSAAAPSFVPREPVHPSLRDRLHDSSSHAQLFEVRETSEKGMGLFATCDISQGTRILCEAPLLEIPFNRLHYTWKCFCDLSSQAKSTYDRLCSKAPSNIDFEKEVHFPDPEQDTPASRGSQIKVMKIFSVNNFVLYDGHYGVFALASRMNHSCVPNVHFTSNAQIRKSTVHAARDVVAGEELLCNYIGSQVVYKTRAERVDFLRINYGFICHCPACSDMTGFCDQRRELLAGIMSGLNEFMHHLLRSTDDHNSNPFLPNSPREALAQAEDAFNLLAEQGLYTMELWKAYHIGSELALQCEEWEKAVAYAFFQYSVEQNLLGNEVDHLKKLGVASVQWIKKVQDCLHKTPGKDKLSKAFWREFASRRSLWGKLEVEAACERKAASKASKAARQSVKKSSKKMAKRQHTVSELKG